jgi:MFS family permease
MVTRLMIADTLSNFGDWFTYVAMASLAVSASRPEVGIGLVLTAHTLPKFLAAPLAGLLADKVDVRRLLIVVNLLRAIVTIAMLASLRSEALWALHVFHFIRMALGSGSENAMRCAYTQTTTLSSRTDVNSRAGLLWNAAQIIGMAIGGLVVFHAGPSVAFAVDVLSFVASIGLLSTLPDLPERAEDATTLKPSSTGLSHWCFSLWMLAKVPVAFVTGAAWTIVTYRSADAALFGGLLAFRSMGAGLVPLLWPPNYASATAQWMLSLAMALIGAGGVLYVDPGAITGLFALLWGAGIGCNWVWTTTQLQALDCTKHAGRTNCIDMLSQGVAQWLGGVVVILFWLNLSAATPLYPIASAASLAIAVPQKDNPQSALETLRDLAVTDDDFYRPVLYTWTTEQSIQELRDNRQLLVATAQSGTFTSPLNRELASTVTSLHASNVARAIALLLTTDPALIRRRYAWPAA